MDPWLEREGLPPKVCKVMRDQAVVKRVTTAEIASAVIDANQMLATGAQG